LLEEYADDIYVEFDVTEDVHVADQPDGTILVRCTLHGEEIIPTSCKDMDRRNKIAVPVKFIIDRAMPDSEPQFEYDSLVSDEDDRDDDDFAEMFVADYL
jgi:hypothetical protein